MLKRYSLPFFKTLRRRTMTRIFKFVTFGIFVVLFSGRSLQAEFGIGAGATLSFVGERSEIYNGSTLLVAKAGLYYSLTLAEPLSLQTGIYLAMKGGRYYDVNRRTNDQVHLNYIEIPVLLCLDVWDNNFELYLGPYAGFLISSTENDDEHSWTWIENEIRDLDIGVSIGARYHFIDWLYAEIQFNNGLTKVVYDPNPVPQSDTIGHINRTVSLLLGFNF